MLKTVTAVDGSNLESGSGLSRPDPDPQDLETDQCYDRRSTFRVKWFLNDGALSVPD